MTDLPSPGYPPADVEVTQSLVEQLVGDQFPELAGAPVCFFGSGWDNTTYRLGSSLAVRMPRIEASVALLVLEQTRLPLLQPHVDVLLPVPVHVGQPGRGYPWPWSIIPWRTGTTAAEADLCSDQAPRLGRILRSLHEMDPAGLERSAWRGYPLAHRTDDLRAALRDLEPEGAIDGLAAVWEDALAAPCDAHDDRWVHADLHPKNILVQDGALASILDWGDMTLGDRAIDLASAWLLFDTRDHPRLWEAYGATNEAMVRRARGWAAFFIAMTLRTGRVSDPAMAEAAERAASRLLG